MTETHVPGIEAWKSLGDFILPTMEEDLCTGRKGSGEMGAEMEKDKERRRMQV